MTDARKYPCGRCGYPAWRNTHATVTGLCGDCQWSDPVYRRATRGAYAADTARWQQQRAWTRAREINREDTR